MVNPTKRAIEATRDNSGVVVNISSIDSGFTRVRWDDPDDLPVCVERMIKDGWMISPRSLGEEAIHLYR